VLSPFLLSPKNNLILNTKDVLIFLQKKHTLTHCETLLKHIFYNKNTENPRKLLFIIIIIITILLFINTFVNIIIIIIYNINNNTNNIILIILILLLIKLILY